MKTGLTAKSGHVEGETLSAYVDGMLDMTRMRQVAVHLGQCAACRQQCEALQSTKALLHAVATPEPPSPDYWANTFRRMRTEAPLRETPSISILDRVCYAFATTQRRWAAGAAMAAVLTVGITSPILYRAVSIPVGTAIPVPLPTDDALDVSALVRDHASAAAHQPLSDPDRQDMISADASSGFFDSTALDNATAEGSDGLSATANPQP